jgi:1-acyl-sn-glycerol-3-phosphate acyltransferase
MKIFWRSVLWLSGWKVKSEIPEGLKKYIIAVAPHTSNHDFLVGLMARGALGLKASFLGKASLFRFPFGILFKYMGGIPVDRSQSHHTVDQIAKIAVERDRFILAIAPEGTRKKVDKWRSGFYFIAHKAGIPIVFAQLDWAHHHVNFLKPFYPSGDLIVDMPLMKSFFSGVQGYHKRN